MPNHNYEHLRHSEITEKAIGAFFEVCKELGHGLGESLYASALDIVLRDLGLRVQKEAVLDVEFRGQRIGHYRADFVVEQAVVLELKAGSVLPLGSREQLLNYLRLSKLEVGLLFFFGPVPDFQRVIHSRR
jgi:GxxExxY protein